MNPVRHTASTEQAFTLVEILVRIGIIILATVVTIRLVYLLIGRIERAIRTEAKGTELAREKRARTIGEVLRGFARGTIIVIGILM